MAIFSAVRQSCIAIVQTLDNPLLSGLTNEARRDHSNTISLNAQSSSEAISRAINCTNGLDDVGAYVRAGTAPATKRAYRADMEHFLRWGGDVPETEERLSRYLAAHATTLKVATLMRRLAAISVAHEARDLRNPVRAPLIRAVMRGIRRQHGTVRHQGRPLLRDDLFAVLSIIGGSPKDIRDRALLLIGFAGGFRRSELVAIDFADVERVRQGSVLTLRRSKTDQDGVGRKIGVPIGRTRWCPVAALDHWLVAASIDDGPLFRRVDRHGRISNERLSPEAVSLIVRERVGAARYDAAAYSGHSLRSGLATSAAQAGVASWRIRQQTGHASDAMLARYVRDGQLFVDNAAGALL
jgi:integrase